MNCDRDSLNSFRRLTAGNNDILLLTNKEQNASGAMLLKLGSKGNWHIALLAEHCPSALTQGNTGLLQV